MLILKKESINLTGSNSYFALADRICNNCSMPTQRQQITDLLSENASTLQELSAELHMSMKELLLHLPHVQKSVKPPKKFIMEPAECLHCGYIFKDRTRLHSPGKCPRCRETHIKEPVYHIA